MTKYKISLHIAITIAALIVSVVTTFYIVKGDIEVDMIRLEDKDIHIEYRIDDMETELKEDIKEVKELVKDMSKKIDSL